MNYTPHTEEDIRQMLASIGASSVEELFGEIPDSIKLGRKLQIPDGLSESEVIDLLARMAAGNTATDQLLCFAGGGAYDHYVPAAVRAVAYRSEFVTSYTPYQPELSQGVLGALFEYQTMVCELTGMDVANASLYDGASALVEAVNLATAATGRTRIYVSAALNPNYRAVLETFGRAQGLDFKTLDAADGTTAVGDLEEAAAVIVAQPNFFGLVEDIQSLSEAAHRAGALLISHFDLLAAGLIASPGELGADVVTGEGQSLGNELNFGGPYLGIFATKMEHVRRVPGRIVGATADVHGQPGFVLTLQAREQHIRREKANSNVCTNQTLMAIIATVYMSWLGPKGLQELSQTCLARAHHAAQALSSVPGCKLRFDGPFLKEFVLQLPVPADGVVSQMAERGFLLGPSLAAADPALADCLLVAVTEKRSVEQIDTLAKTLAEVVA